MCKHGIYVDDDDDDDEKCVSSLTSQLRIYMYVGKTVTHTLLHWQRIKNCSTINIRAIFANVQNRNIYAYVHRKRTTKRTPLFGVFTHLTQPNCVCAIRSHRSIITERIERVRIFRALIAMRLSSAPLIRVAIRVPLSIGGCPIHILINTLDMRHTDDVCGLVVGFGFDLAALPFAVGFRWSMSMCVRCVSTQPPHNNGFCVVSSLSSSRCCEQQAVHLIRVCVLECVCIRVCE